jgi:hypothetical protein
MRVALFVASMLALTAPAQASSSCMSKSEARKHFASLHLYWHGPDHCWDATPGRHRLVRKNPTNVDRQVQRRRPHSDWRQARSEMLPDDGPVQVPGVQIASSAAAVGASWMDRWIDIVPVMPQLRADSGPSVTSPALASEPESGGIPHFIVVLAFFAFLLIFATIEILFRKDEQHK